MAELEEMTDGTEDCDVINIEYKDPISKDYITFKNNECGGEVLKPSLFIEKARFDDIQVVEDKE